MGESSVCLLRSFSQPSPTSQESSEEDPIRRALTSSVSFGRFVSESLALDKWSAFNQNRYLEEAEKYSKPGSVAAKKAYFEAHYKKIAAKKAAVLLEQQCPAVDNISVGSKMNENDDNSAAEMELVQESVLTKIAEMHGENTHDADVLLSVGANWKTLPEERNAEGAQTEGADQDIGHPFSTEKDVKPLSSHQMDVEIVENPCTSGDSAPSDKSEAAFSSGKPSSNDGRSKSRSSVKPNLPIYPRKWDHTGNPLNKKTSTQSLEKRPTPQALHMSISFTSRGSDTSKTSSAVSQKIVDSRLCKPIVKKSAESSNRQTLIRASISGVPRRRVTPQLENSRTKTILDQSVSGSISRGNISNSSLQNGKSKPERGSKVKSPTLSSSFSLRSEERAAKRKEFFQKLEQKLNSKVEKELHYMKQKGKAKGGCNVVWQSVSSLSEGKANFHSSTKSASIAAKKVATQSYSPKMERNLASEAQDNYSRPPWRFSMKTDSFRDAAEKNSSKVTPKKSKCENTSPNIQLSMYKGCSKTDACRKSMKE